MSSTEDLDRISAIVAAAGAKLLYIGDHEQLAAVGAGGMLELLVRDAGAVELTDIHRFTHAWERAASIRLRVADPDAAGRVSAEVLGQTRDGNLIGVGDLIQARRNDYTLRVHGGRPVTNRE